MIKDYIIKERLGTGAFGVVFKVLKKSNNTIYVIKQISLLGLTYQQKNEAKLEAKILSSVRSNYIVRYYESFEENNYLNIVMEYCDGGDLSQFINKNKKTRYLLKEDLIWNIFLKITIGLATLHKSKILHRDLKTLNVFLTHNLDIKIGDFGVAKILTKSGFAKTIIGTPYYLSPELCEEKPYNDKSDVWALGCILYELTTYKHPFNAKCQASLILKILQSEPEPIHNYYSEDLQKLITLILDKNYLTRPSCYEILNLPFVIEKAKNLGLYSKINLLYPQQNPSKKIVSNYSTRTYMIHKENKSKVYDQKTAPSKKINKNYSKISYSKCFQSEQNRKINNDINKEKEKPNIRENNRGNHVIYISKSNDNYQKINNLKENRNKSFERNQNPIKERVKTNHIISISNLDNVNNIKKINKISNISYININNPNNIKNSSNINNNNKQIKDIKDNKQIKEINDNNNQIKVSQVNNNQIKVNQVNNNQIKVSQVNNNQIKDIKDTNNIQNKKVFNSINEFENKLKNKNNIKNKINKIVVINRLQNPNNQDSNNLNIEDDILKDIKITDILDNKEIDTMIQKKLSQNNNNNNKMFNMKEFATYLNNYVSRASESNINSNNKNKNKILKNNNNMMKNYNSYLKGKTPINTDANNNKNKIVKVINKNNEIKNYYSNNYSVDINQNPKYYEKLVINSIYDNKDKDNNNKNIINNKSNIYIYNSSNKLFRNNTNNTEEKNDKNKNFKKNYSNDVILLNKNKKILNQNGNIINIINSNGYNNKNSQNKMNYLGRKKEGIYNYVTSDNYSNNQQII